MHIQADLVASFHLLDHKQVIIVILLIDDEDIIDLFFGRLLGNSNLRAVGLGEGELGMSVMDVGG